MTEMPHAPSPAPASSPRRGSAPGDGGAKVWGSRFFIVLVQLEASSSPTFQVSERAGGAPCRSPPRAPTQTQPCRGVTVLLCQARRMGILGAGEWGAPAGRTDCCPREPVALPVPRVGESVLSVRAALWCYLRGHRCWPRPPPCSALASTARMGEQGAPTHGRSPRAGPPPPGDPAGLVLTSGSGQEPGDVAAPRAASARHRGRLGLGASDPLLPLCRT